MSLSYVIPQHINQSEGRKRDIYGKEESSCFVIFKIYRLCSSEIIYVNSFYFDLSDLRCLSLTNFNKLTVISSVLYHDPSILLHSLQYYFVPYVDLSLTLPGGLWVSTPTHEGPWAACQLAVCCLRETVSFLFLGCYHADLLLFTINGTRKLSLSSEFSYRALRKQKMNN